MEILTLGVQIFSTEFELFFSDLRNNSISNIYFRKSDFEKHMTLIFLGEKAGFNYFKDKMLRLGTFGVILELENSIFYQFDTGYDKRYYLRLAKPIEYPSNEEYVSIKDSGLPNVERFINKKPSHFNTDFTYGETTFLKQLKMFFTDDALLSFVVSDFQVTVGENNYPFDEDNGYLIFDKSIVDNFRFGYSL